MKFIVKTGYNENDFISVDSIADVEKAQYAFMTEAKVVFSNGEVCRGKDIISIKEDWHGEMGWNRAHKMDENDWNELKNKGILSKYTGQLGLAKENVATLMSAKRNDLIGKEGKIEERLKLLHS